MEISPTPDLNQIPNLNPNPVPTNPGRFNKTVILIIVGVIILAGVAYGGIWYWQNKNSEVVMPTFTPRPNPTADWKTYYSAKLNLSFKYPANYFIMDRLNNEEKAILLGDKNFPKPEIAPWYQAPITLEYNESQFNNQVSDLSSIKRSTMVIDGQSVDIIEGSFSDYPAPGMPANNHMKIITIPSKNLMISAQDSYGGMDSDWGEISSVLTNIISTLKFIEPTDTSSWKTYRNEQYGLEFKYPKNWPEPTINTTLANTFTGAVEPFSGKAISVYEFGPRKDIEGAQVSSYEIWIYPLSNKSEVLNKIKSSSQFKGGLITIKNTSLTIGGSSAIRYDEGGLCGYPTAIIFVQSYTLKVVSNCNDIRDDHLDQILSTFKFTK